MVRVPINASYEVQTAIQDIISELDKFRLRLDAKQDDVSLRALDEMGAKVAALSSKPNTLDFNDVFRGSGPAHAIGYVPDPGATTGTSRYLNENGQWVTPVVVFYVADSLTVTVGTPTGNVTHTQVQDDGNVLHIDEVTGTPGFDLILDFVGVVSPNFLVVHSYYNGNHHPAVQAYNYDLADWDALDTYDDAATLQGRTYTLTSSHASSGGAARVRFYHSQSGSASHDLFIDYVAIQSGGLNPSAIDHGVLAGLSDLDHPASAIINDSSISGASVKDAINNIRWLRFGGTLPSPATGQQFVVARCPVAGTVTNVYGMVVGGTSVVMNAQRGTNTTDLRSANITVNAAAGWVDFSTLQNATVAAGDAFWIEFVTVTGAVTYAAIQIEVVP